MFRILLAIATVCFMVHACSPDGAPRRGPVAASDPAKPTEAIRAGERTRLELTGRIARSPVEGGVYVIRTDDGNEYRLVELADEFREEGLEVTLVGLRHDDVLTKDMGGQAVDIVEIRKR